MIGRPKYEPAPKLGTWGRAIVAALVRRGKHGESNLSVDEVGRSTTKRFRRPPIAAARRFADGDHLSRRTLRRQASDFRIENRSIAFAMAAASPVASTSPNHVSLVRTT